MRPLLARLFFSRVLTAVLLANFASLVVLNLLGLSAASLVFVYLPALAAGYLLLQRFRLRRREPAALDPLALGLIALTVLLLLAPRLSYASEWLPGNEVRVLGDDHARLAELIAMTLSPRYPLQHPANPDFLLSHYYSAFYPMALLKFVLPVLTLKDTILLGNLLYHLLILLSVLEVAQLLLRDAGAVRVLIFTWTLFAGLDWLLRDPLAIDIQHEWWQEGPLFNGNTQISGFYTGLFWTVHHFVGFYAVILAYVWLFHARAPSRPLKALVVLLLLAAGFYASPFGVLPVPLFALAHRGVVWNRLIRTPLLPAVALAALVPLFTLLGRDSSQGFQASTFRLAVTGDFWLDKLLSAPVYLTLVPLVEFAGLPLLLAPIVPRLPRTERAYLAASLAFFVLTYLVAYSGANNIAMRGMFLPTAVLFFLFAKYHRRLLPAWPAAGRTAARRLAGLALVVALAATSWGTLRMLGGLMYISLTSTSGFYRLIGRPVPPHLQLPYRELARDGALRSYRPNAEDRHTVWKYHAEKLVDRLEPDEMADWEKELLRGPRTGLFR